MNINNLDIGNYNFHKKISMKAIKETIKKDC